MTGLSRIRVGQAGDVRAAPPAPDADTDKWQLLDALTRASEIFGLNHRTLGVLRALLSFFPDRVLPVDPGHAVVYPSNRVLSQRLNGMPESTLRRHLSTLVSRGIVSRQDSANRKRFARFGGVAFGFDLAPLARAAQDVRQAAAEAQARHDRLESLRAVLAATRQRVLDADALPPDHPLVEEARLVLRRRVGPEVLETLLRELEIHLDAAGRVSVTADELSAHDSENERHIQVTSRIDSVRRKAAPEHFEAEVTLNEITRVCTEYRSYFPDVSPDWHGLVQASDHLRPMMGIDREVYDAAKLQLGQQVAATAVVCMLEKISDIRNPGAYLRGLLKKAQAGQFDLRAMVRGASKRSIVS